jgi:hypothetical protein
MSTWEKECFKQLRREQGETKRKSNVPTLTRNPRQVWATIAMAVAALTIDATSAARGMLRVGMQKAAANIAAGHGFKHPFLPLAANAAASKPADSSKSGSKYGPGDKSDKYKSVRFSDKDNKQYRDNRGRSTSLLVVTYHVYMR